MPKPIFLIEFDSEPSSVGHKISQSNWVVKLEQEGNVLKVIARDVKTAQSELTRIIASSSLPLRSFQIVEPSLEEIFLKMVRDDKRISLPEKRI